MYRKAMSLLLLFCISIYLTGCTRVRQIPIEETSSLRDKSHLLITLRDGRTIETIGQYNPQPDPSLIVIDEDRAKHWLEKGARPTKTVATLLRTKGIQSTGT